MYVELELIKKNKFESFSLFVGIIMSYKQLNNLTFLL